MSQADLQTWTAAAMALPESKTNNPLSLPIAIFLGEVVDLAREVEAHWEPREGLPGLRHNGGKLELDIKDELITLRRAVNEADARWLLIVDPKTPRGALDLGRKILRELVNALVYLLDDDIEEPADEQLAALKASHDDTSENPDVISKALYAYAKLADSLRSRLQELEDENDEFSVAFIDEAFQLSEEIAKIPPGNIPPSPEANAALALRNRLLHLLDERAGRIRRAARFRYRNHPEIQKKFTSAYERRRRAENRKKGS
jgi:hypothetical protein